jgi:DNA-binding LacI/PurR family transcriptional regulator
MFVIDRNKSETLCDQISEGFRRAIAAGEYKPGDRLPQMRELSADFGVSIRVIVRAFAKLEAERLVFARPGVGCVVTKPPKSFWKGQILVIVPGGDYVYCQNICAGIVCDRLSVRGYMVQRVTVPAFGRDVYDFRSLDLLLRMDTSLVVMIGPQPEIERHLASSNVRYVVIGQASVQSAKCIGTIGNDVLSAVEDLAAHAARAGVVNAVLVGANYSDFHPIIRSALISKSIKVKEWKIRTGVHVSGRLDVMQVKTRDFFREKLRSGENLPDLFVFIDEYRAMGGALALYEAGVRIPEDARFVTVSNVGNGPVLRKGVARIEYNPFKNGRRIADILLHFLSTGEFPSNAMISARYVPDETFPRR